jgi:FkbM family methyltransferase
VFSVASRLRHGPLAAAGFVWRPLGHIYRTFQAWSQVPNAVRKRLGQGGSFVFDGRFAFSNFEKWGGRHNANFGEWIDACRTAKCVFDVGAHIGLTSMPVGQLLLGRGTVYAFEPGIDNVRFLRRHLALNGLVNVEVVEALVGPEEAENVVLFELPGDSGLNTTAPGYLGERATQLARSQVTLDGFCRRFGVVPDVIKIDVEGAEVGVLSGAAEILREHCPIIFLSVHPKQISAMGHSVAHLLDMIRGFGYEVFDEAGQPVERLSFAEYKLINTGKGASA